MASLRILCVIPARAGSKRVPRKNCKVLNDKPLIQWSIEVAKKTQGISEIIVSTDDDEIAQIARSAGVAPPWLRPVELSSDASSIVDVLLHALDHSLGSAFDAVMLLQPTSPFREPHRLEKAIELYKSGDARSVIGVSESGHYHPLWSFQEADGIMRPFNSEGLSCRSQELPKSFHVNGYVYIVSPSFLQSSRSLFTTECIPLVISDPMEACDIDTPDDWNYAVYVAGLKRASHLDGA